MVCEVFPIEAKESDRPAPLWTKIGAEGPGRPAGRVAVLDVYNSLFVPRRERVSEDEIAALRARGLTDDGAYALRHFFGAGNLSDLKEVAVQAVTEGGFTAILTFPNNDSVPDNRYPLCPSGCPYLAGMFGKDPKDLDLFGIQELREMPKEFIELINRRGYQMKWKEYAICERGECDRQHIRDFHLEAMRLVYTQRREGGNLQEFDGYWTEHAKDGDRLLDYAVTAALQKRHGGLPWYEWPEEIVSKKPVDLIAQDPALQEEVRLLLFTQQELGLQWDAFGDALNAVGGYHIEDRAYSVMWPSPEVWRDWREQYREGKKPGIFHINEDKTPAFESGCNVEGDPWGAQIWHHVVLKYQENPDVAIDYIIETIEPDEGRVSMRRIDHALAWIWQYYRIRQGGKVEEGEYIPALKEKIFRRLRERFPDTEWMLEDCGYTDDGLKGFMEWVGCGPMSTVQWAPHPRDPSQPRSRHFETYSALPHGGTAFLRNADTRADDEWFRWLTDDNRRFYLARLYGNEHVAERWQRHVEGGEPIPVEDWMKYMFRCRARLAIASFQSCSAIIPGKRDERRENVPGSEHPSYWQLLSTLTRQELPTVFRKTRKIIETTRGSVHRLLATTGLQILALSQNPGMGQYVGQGDTFRLKIACNRAPLPDERVTLTSNTPWSSRKNGQGWGEESTRIDGCTHYKDDTYVWDVSFDVPCDAPLGTYQVAGTIHAQSGRHDLCYEHRNILLQVEPSAQSASPEE
ncbi:TPA: hypothetical protein DCS34_01605 [Candidatus Peribacteria bacterium]|nr:MAG: hypothetical protein A2529_05115 [Candidatus Peribacteria bacterium RIFOXYD2_FULL_58_15]HAS33989.1 hypothetical protein [Candidatus Peribacteria bacterium]